MNGTKFLVAVLWVASLVTTASASLPVGPINFSSAADYDNTANTVIAGPTPVYNQTSGLFRDVIWWSLNNGQPRVGSGDYIERGNSLVVSGNQAVPGPGPYTALNFLGPAVSGGQSYLTVYDTTPADGTATKDLFDASTQTLKLSVDVLFAEITASVSAGVVALYNEGQSGLGLLAHNGGGNNADVPKLDLVFQSAGLGTVLTSVSLPGSSFVPLDWYRVTMNLSVSGDTWTMNGSFQNHLVGTDPTSGLGSVITTLSYTGSLSAQNLTNPGEVGLMAQGNNIALPNSVGVSFTNFEVVPEPTSFVLTGLGLGLFALLTRGTSGRKRV